MKRLTLLGAAAFICINATAQENDTIKNVSISLDEVVISVNKEEETKKSVAQQVEVLDSKDIEKAQALSTADLLQSTGIHVQKSQLGGGSAVLRGFEASRIGLVVDGVRMNNLIFRAGHLQDIVKTDNNIFDRVEILYGPASTIYGSDALGGVIHMYTKKPRLAFGEEKSSIKLNLLTRYESVCSGITSHVDFNYGTRKVASLTSFSYNMYGDLMGGRNQNPFYDTAYGERLHYVEHIGIVNNAAKDSLVKNDNRYLQVGSGYNQYDILEKVLYQQSEKMSHGLNIQYSNSTNVPRYDRLTDPSGPGLASAEWYYGPQKRLLAAYDMNIKNPGTFEGIHVGINYQSLEESRHNRNFGSRFRTHRIENVSVIGTNIDLQKKIKKHDIRFGLDAQLNSLTSAAERENIVLGTAEKWDSRYPDGDNKMNNIDLYFSHTWKINEQLTLTDGIRAGYSMLHSTLVDTAVMFHLPYLNIEQNTPVYSGSIGLIHSPSDDLKLSVIVSTGFRVPNVDDVTKVFGPVPGTVIVPNPDLKPEKTLNYELGITRIMNKKTRWENSIYYTTFKDVAVVDSFQLNGKDSLLYDGSMARVYANQNKARAYVYGFSSNLISQLDEYFRMTVSINYTYGRVQTDSSNSPLDHIPPFSARTSLMYTAGKFSSDLVIQYSGAKKLKDYGGAEDNPQYATPMGMPAWFTVNLRASYKMNKMITVQAGVDNIFDTEYRTFASGINAPGRNFILALRGSF